MYMVEYLELLNSQSGQNLRSPSLQHNQHPSPRSPTTKTDRQTYICYKRHRKTEPTPLANPVRSPVRRISVKIETKQNHLRAPACPSSTITSCLIPLDSCHVDQGGRYGWYLQGRGEHWDGIAKSNEVQQYLGRLVGLGNSDALRVMLPSGSLAKIKKVGHSKTE